jgi:hypothetical protein
MHPLNVLSIPRSLLLEPAKQKALLDELAQLTEEQSDALNLAMYVGMSLEEGHMYDERVQRINQLSDLVIANLRNL